MRLFSCVLFLCILSACSAVKPWVWGNPRTYLAEFPLGLKQSELYAKVGAPSAIEKLGDAEIWTYGVTESERGPRYEYEITGGAVTNVTYRSTIGMYDGLTAKRAREK